MLRQSNVVLATLRRRFLIVASVGLAAVAAQPAQAVIIAGGVETTTPSAHESPPATNPYWGNVGWRGFGTAAADGATAVYLGNRYVITAAHVGAGPVVFFTDDPAGGTSFAVDGSFTPYALQNPAAVGGTADAVIFRLQNDPGLAALTISAAPPTIVDNSLQIIGTGRERGSALTAISPGNGYTWAATRDKIWGVNEAIGSSTVENVGGGNSIAFRTQFDNQNGEAQLADKDSGSGAFGFNAINNRWELVGLGFAVASFQGQPGETSLFGNQSLFVDLSAYKSQIDPIPEPATMSMLAIGCAVLALRRRRRPMR